tara:strand:- start:192 stop:593 length:402 start_codon:yes stop_codon:yes gene_type:complete
MSFIINQKILFKHCDPAGIVFYPRYFEIINDCTESFFDITLDWPFENLLNTYGIPTAQIKTIFLKPSRHGDVLQLECNCLRVGNSSVDIKITAKCGKEVRFVSDFTLVLVNSKDQPHAWPERIKSKFIEIVSK